MEKLKSEGKCCYCDQTFSSAGISRHLSGHLKQMEKESTSSSKAFHLKVSAAEMFLHLLVNGACTLGKLDHFLRSIWLECCGHLSSFQVKGKPYDFNFDSDEEEFGESMSSKLSEGLKKGVKLQYEYDFGSTTQLDLQVMNEYQLKPATNIVLLSRNEPLQILCHLCKKEPAKVICSVCIYEGPSMFCKSCAKKHKKSCSDFADYSKMSVVNSPRMGVCGYEGGSIDLERDGIYQN